MSTPKSSFFSSRLREIRGDKSQQEFAQFLGIGSQQAYQRYEGGRIPRIDVLLAMSQRLGVTMESLLGNGVSKPSGASIKPSIVADGKPVWNCGKMGTIDESGNISTPVETYIGLLDAQVAAERWHDAAGTAASIREYCEQRTSIEETKNGGAGK